MEINESPFASFTGQRQVVEYAGFWLRFVAYLIDTIVLWLPNAIISTLFGLGFSGAGYMNPKLLSNPAALSAVMGAAFVSGLLSLIMSWLYFSLMESSKLQATVGKMALRLKVTNNAGNRISFGQATGRFFGKIISSVILMIGFMMAGWTEKKQALHDIIADTLVIKSNPYQVVQGNNTVEGY